MQSVFILSTVNNFSVIGYVQEGNAPRADSPDQFFVTKASDLEALSNSQLTTMFNAITGETKSIFKTAKTQSAEKVYAALTALDISTLVKLDEVEEVKLDKQAETIATAAAVIEVDATPIGPKIRKVRDSKLQRMAAAFRIKDDAGNYKQWTVKELMEVCGKKDDPMTSDIAKVYISILRAKNDRFVMNIVKDKDTGAFVYSPDQPAA